MFTLAENHYCWIINPENVKLRLHGNWKSQYVFPLRAEMLDTADEFTRLEDVFTVWHMGVKRNAVVILLP